jgi:DNA-directed RNA polymerase specialized sigma24 family protein
VSQPLTAATGHPTGARSRQPDPVADLAAYLGGEYRLGEPLRVAVRRPNGSGSATDEWLVPALEVGAAHRSLPLRQRRVVELLYQDDLPAIEVASRLGVCTRTVWSDRVQALTAMAGVIYEWDAIERGRD